MKFNNVHKIFSTNVTNIHKCLQKILFSRQTESFFLSEFCFDSLRCEKSIFFKHLWMLVKLVEKIFVYIVKLHVKSGWHIKFVVLRLLFYPPDFWPKNTLKWTPFWTYSFHFFSTKKFPQLVNSRKKPFLSNSAHIWGHSQCLEWNRKEGSPLQWEVHPGAFLPYIGELFLSIRAS